MDSFLFGYYDPFTGSLIIQIITVAIFSIGASFRYWRKKLMGLFHGPSKGNEYKNE